MARGRLAPPRTEDYRRVYPIWPTGEEKAGAERLRLGLERLPKDFAARLCPMCDGLGQYKQTFTAGCGGGYFTSMASCDVCNGSGLVQGDSPAPDSVHNQVLTAAEGEADVE